MNDPLDDDARGRLAGWLDAHVGVTEPIGVAVLSGGASNLTLAVDAGPRRLVVRRPPIGHFLPTAHDMSREYRVYRALHPTPVPVPEPLALCEDAGVIGAPFYVMAHVDGLVPHDAAALAGVPPETNERTAAAYVAVLAAIHALDVDAVGLGGLAKRDGYLERQVARWTDQWERSKLDESPAVDELARRLAATLPPSPEVTLVHGDYRLGNLMLDPADTGRILAVLDWEMATLGDPLADVGYALLYWGTRDRPPFHPSQAVADLPGFPDAGGLAERYAAATGRGCEGIDWYVGLAAFKLAIIGEGQRARLRRTGQAGPGGRSPGQPLAAWAVDRLGPSGGTDG